ncbi:hypothetical protein R70723_10065 [Paenibacillus sp. FSL R7-0273]|uniref:hypothetical protein n=1 Tax=Paenibacillus sp. FSL R7-0273 TaxID=1536772 RepID=UPI0004F86268|nr:hypothetical protein [Paenibacillus sp. FSL R7-0273]AIQ46191.1 hypothetical protein R70723_10065 [Paenibacillus sp. FSL R7-0273]OMF84973.1 hypothetical protein BK144_28885 [Paenibacillus sp. FSL R7-0273]
MKPARKAFELNALEIIYLTALTGGTSFPGLETILTEESDRGLRSLMDAQMRSLEVKGYLETDFTGNAQVKEELHEFICAATGSKAYLSQIIQWDEGMVKVSYFFREGTWFELEHQPDGTSYRVQEIYAWHELMFQVVNRIPLVQSSDSSGELLSAAEESELEKWAGQCLLTGASVLSLAEIRCTAEEAEVYRDLNLLIHDDQMWLLRRETDEEVMRTSVSFATALKELIAWLQDSILSGEDGHADSIDDLSV